MTITNTERLERIAEAEAKIRDVLEALEVRANGVVRKLEIAEVEVTSLGHASRQLGRQVVIELEPHTGRPWLK